MFVKSEDTFSPSLFYIILFVPFVIFSAYVCLSNLLWHFKRTKGKELILTSIHFAGYIIFTFFGSLDMLRVILAKDSSGGISYTIFGVLILGIILTFTFTENLISLINDRLLYIGKLKTAYKELEHARDLSELGKSTSMINHEIKNYAFIIKGNAECLRDVTSLDEMQTRIVSSIISSADDMARFSKEILNFSKAKIITNRPIDIHNLLKTCIQNNFDQKVDKFILNEPENPIMVHGDWKKLEQTFVNMFLNALEADATKIMIKIHQAQFVVLLTIEDNGKGCCNVDLAKLFTAFFTTKEKGTGLGLATCRAIIEGHGGHISAISKNCITDGKEHGEHGLIFSITFPIFQSDPDKKDPIILIEDNIENLQQIIQLFKNVSVNPHFVSSVNDLSPKKFKLSEFIILGCTKSIAHVKQKHTECSCISIVETANNIIYAIESKQGGSEHVFTEEFIISLIKTKAEGVESNQAAV
jgi:signal transduction histidine kinase